jgi:hypothetical protein
MKKQSMFVGVLVSGAIMLPAVQAMAQVSPQTKIAIDELRCTGKFLSDGSAIGGVKTLACLWNKPALKFTPRTTPPHYQSLPPLRAPEPKDFRSLLPPFRPLTR